MTAQPEALRLAEAIEYDLCLSLTRREAAAELRRLHDQARGDEDLMRRALEALSALRSDLCSHDDCHSAWNAAWNSKALIDELASRMVKT